MVKIITLLSHYFYLYLSPLGYLLFLLLYPSFSFFFLLLPPPPLSLSLSLSLSRPSFFLSSIPPSLSSLSHCVYPVNQNPLLFLSSSFRGPSIIWVAVVSPQGSYLQCSEV